MIRMSQLLLRTLREAPSEIDAPGARFLFRAGCITFTPGYQLAFPPLGALLLQKLVQRVRSFTPTQEVILPPGGSMNENQVESFANILRPFIRSYKDLPRTLFAEVKQENRKFKSNAGLLNPPQLQKTVFCCTAADDTALQAWAAQMQREITQLLTQSRIPYQTLEDKFNHSIYEVFIHPGGSHDFAFCPHCCYGAPLASAQFQRPAVPQAELLPVEPVHTPKVKTIDELASFLNISASQTAKAVFLVARFDRPEGHKETFVFAVIRGDLEVNEHKLMRALGASSLRPASEDEIRAVGAVPGFASPVGLRGVYVVADPSASAPNLVAGANQEDTHLRNVNLGRDYKPSLTADFAMVQPGHPCPNCGQPLQVVSAVPLAESSRHSPALPVTYLNPSGQQKPASHAICEISVNGWLGAAAEANCDPAGLCWPAALSPLDVHLVTLRGGEAAGEALAQELTQAGFQILWDDRDESPGVKFADADLIGLPIRLTLSDRSLKAGGVEWKARAQEERQVLPLSEIPEALQTFLADLQHEEQSG
ncbi:proline--tRNA ligase [Levilinea saccharolytica]|nr:YbaK/EbsC family protein [Levilinea saccharolytica]GAP18046.1 prolyl-tRNA synthetase [Levilinea saccharolytica]